MAEMSTGIMDLLSKLIGERENFLGRTEMPKGLKGAISDKEYQTLRDGGSEIPTELQGLKTPTNFLAKGGMSDQEFDTLKNGRNTYGATHTMPDGTVMQGATHGSGRGSYADSNITGGQTQFINAMNNVDNGALSGFMQQATPNLKEMGVNTSLDLNIPPEALRTQMMDIFKSSNLSGFPEGKPSQRGAVNQMGAVAEREMEALRRSEMATMGVDGASSDVDTMFAQALNSMSPDKASEVIMTIQGYTPDQQTNFKQQFLAGNVSPYELEMQSNLGF